MFSTKAAVSAVSLFLFSAASIIGLVQLGARDTPLFWALAVVYCATSVAVLAFVTVGCNAAARAVETRLKTLPDWEVIALAGVVMAALFFFGPGLFAAALELHGAAVVAVAELQP